MTPLTGPKVTVASVLAVASITEMMVELVASEVIPGIVA